MTSCCPICYRVGIGIDKIQSSLKNGKESQKKEVELQKRFFRLLQRYLNEDGDRHDTEKEKRKIHFPLEEYAGIGMLACEQCSKLMESFCELYHQLKSIELFINRKLETLNNVMRCAQKVPSRMYHFQKFMGNLELDESGWSSLDDLIKSVNKTTKHLIMKCSLKTTNAFPKLSIAKWQSLEEPSGPPHYESQQGRDNLEGFCSEDDEVANSLIAVEGLTVFNKSTIVADGPQTCPGRANADYSCNQDTWQTPTILKSLLTCDTNSSPEKIYQPTFPAPEILTGSKADANNLVVKTASLQDDNYSFKGNDADDNDEPSSDNQSCWSVATETKPNIRENIKVPSIFQSFFQRQGQDAQVSMDSKNVGEMGPQSLPSPIYDETVVSDEDYIDSDGMSWTSSSSEEDTAEFEYDHSPNSDLDVKVLAPVQTANGSNLWYTKMTARLQNQSYYRLKCPDCHGLFTCVQELLVHRKECDPYCATYDPAKSVKVDVMVQEKRKPTGSVKTQTLATQPEFTSHFATIDLPQAIFICEIDNCGAIKYTGKDLETHKNLHGVFPCQFCNVEMDFAPDLAIHELQQHSKSVKVGTDKCPRCDFVFVSCGGNPYYVQHHLSGHLALTWHDSMCAICKTQLTKLPRDFHLHTSHFKVQHDISNVPEKDIFHCQVENCSAYFLRSYQLGNHTRLCHKDDKSVDESSSEQIRSLESGSVPHVCKYCGKTFPDKSGLQIHCRLHTGPDTWRYSCDICSKKCPTKTAHESHMRSHREMMHVNVMEKVLDEMGSRMKVKEKRIPAVTELESELPNCEESIKRPLLKQSFYRLKCPDCNGLFNSGEDLLIHRKTSSPCLASYNPETSINVEVLLAADDAGTTKAKGGIRKDVQFTTVHAVISLPQAIFICEIENCGRVQYTSENLEAHKKLHGSFSCQFCIVTVNFAPELSLHELKQHSKKLTGSKLLSCPRCDFKSEKRRSAFVRHHLGTHLSLFVNEPFCGICKTNTFNTESVVWKHAKHFKLLHDISNVTEEEIMRCPMEDCNAYFLQRLQLRYHLRRNHNTNLNKRVKNRKSRSRHKKNLKWPEPPSKGEVYVPKLKKYKCKDCGKNYLSLNKLNIHRVKHHVNPDKTIPCPFPKCNKVFETRRGMEAHKKCHSVEYFQTRMDPNRKRVYVQCHQCGKSVDGSNPTPLVAHMKSHEHPKVARPYICEMCGKAFKVREKLRQHHLVHSGPASWEFMCSICSKKCPTQQKLDEHMRTHTKEKPFICQVCGVKYAHRHNLRIHVNSKHGEQVEDKPRKFDNTNLSPKKGVKKKRMSKVESEEEELTSGSSTDSE